MSRQDIQMQMNTAYGDDSIPLATQSNQAYGQQQQNEYMAIVDENGILLTSNQNNPRVGSELYAELSNEEEYVLPAVSENQQPIDELPPRYEDLGYKPEMSPSTQVVFGLKPQQLMVGPTGQPQQLMVGPRGQLQQLTTGQPQQLMVGPTGQPQQLMVGPNGQQNLMMVGPPSYGQSQTGIPYVTGAYPNNYMQAQQNMADVMIYEDNEQPGICYSTSCCCCLSFTLMVIFLIFGGPLTLVCTIPAMILLILATSSTRSVESKKRYRYIGIGLFVGAVVLTLFLAPIWGFSIYAIVVFVICVT